MGIDTFSFLDLMVAWFFLQVISSRVPHIKKLKNNMMPASEVT
jgi:hypothetical protein